MKLQIVLVFLCINFYISNAQTQSTGSITLDSNMSVKFDKNSSNSTITITLTGPSDRWFSIGIDAQLMLMNSDCIVMTSDSQLSDMYFPGGHVAPNFDITNDWIIDSNSVSNLTRTVVATRPFSTGDSKDFIFTDTTNNLNFIWAYSSTPSYILFSHGGDNYGGGVAVFNDLGGVQDFSPNNRNVAIYPNPSNNIWNFKTNSTEMTSIAITEITGKVVFTKAISVNEYSVNASDFSNGMYFATVTIGQKSETFKLVKN